MKLAVIGAGIAGLACARELKGAGLDVDVFEKSRGVGGRMPTRWIGPHPGVTGFDHGTQYFTADHPAFTEAVDMAHEAGAVRPWEGQLVDLSYGETKPRLATSMRWVGVPGMASFAKSLANGLSVLLQTRVERIEPAANRTWSLKTISTAGEGGYVTGYDGVVVAVPAEQAVDLLMPVDWALADRAASVKSNPNWTVMVKFDEPLVVPMDGAFIHDSPLGWAARDSSKPGRAEGERWLLQATAAWSQTHISDDPQTVARMLVDVFLAVVGARLHPVSAVAHRWLYSAPIESLGEEFFWKPELRLGACGDWVKGPRVESAYLSGWALGKKIASSVSRVK